MYFPGKVERNLEEFLKRDYDFVMVLVPGKMYFHILKSLWKKGFPFYRKRHLDTGWRNWKNAGNSRKNIKEKYK